MFVQNYQKPLPVVDPISQGYWDHAREHRLSVQCCDACGDLHFPPMDVCPACLGIEQHWRAVSGYGTLQSWVRFHRAYWDGYRQALPYDVCLVRLDEGPLVLANFSGETQDLRAGLRMRAVFEDVTSTISLVRFELV